MMYQLPTRVLNYYSRWRGALNLVHVSTARTTLQVPDQNVLEGPVWAITYHKDMFIVSLNWKCR